MSRYAGIGLVCAALLWGTFLARAEVYVEHHIYFNCASGECDVTPSHTYGGGYVYDQSGNPVATLDTVGGIHGWDTQPMGFVYQP